MKSICLFIFSISAFLFLGSCAKVVVNYGNPSPNSGNIVIKTTSAIYANLTVNDSLLVNQRFVKSITIKNVPQGANAIHFSANSQNLKDAMDKKLQVNVVNGKTNTQLLTVPPRSNGYWFYQATSVAAFLGYFIWLINFS